MMQHHHEIEPVFARPSVVHTQIFAEHEPVLADEQCETNQSVVFPVKNVLADRGDILKKLRRQFFEPHLGTRKRLQV